MKKRLLQQLAIIFGLTFTLSGCIFVAGAAAGAAAIAVVYDHRAIEHRLDDSKVANEISDRLRQSVALKKESHIEVTVFNYVVLLIGQTPKALWKQKAEDIAKSTPGVLRVYNQISIENPTSSLTRTSDAWITTKIKAKMLATEALHSSSIKVVTENGVVFLMGNVKKGQANMTVDIARQVSGVQKVVKIFRYKN